MTTESQPAQAPELPLTRADLRIEKYLGTGHRVAAPLVARAARLELPFADRSRSRQHARLSDGREVAIFLPRGTVMRGGDLLVDAEGGLVQVVAAPQAVLEVRAGSAQHLMRAAYHLGNRHTPVEVGDGYLRLEDDPVLAEMLERLGVQLERVSRPFEPEAGAYGGGHRHGGDETFAEDHALAQAVFAHRHGSPADSAAKYAAKTPVKIAVKSSHSHAHGPGESCCGHHHGDHDHHHHGDGHSH